MRTIQYVRAGCLIGTLGACMLMAGLARADVTTERPGSILIFPKVVNAQGRNTIIQITNTGNSIDNLRCFYLDAQTGPSGQKLCQVTDFFLSLTKQQPTHWVVGSGRPVDPSDSVTGFDPGLIPPVGSNFVGALVCAEVGDDDVPVGQNKLKGEATLVDASSADVSKYSGIAVQAKSVGPDNLLSLNNTEYNACSTAAQFNFIPDGANDPVIEALGNGGTCATVTNGTRNGLGCNNDSECPISGDGTATCNTGQSRVFNTITVLPCNLDFQNQVASKFNLNYLVTDGDEAQFSFSDSKDRSCWASINLADIKPAALPVSAGGDLLGPFATIRLSAASGGPFLFVAESFHVDADGNSAAAAVNVHTLGLCHGTSGPALSCVSDADCTGAGTGICDLTAPATIRLPQLP
jgi:hypothetical protein